LLKKSDRLKNINEIKSTGKPIIKNSSEEKANFENLKETDGKGLHFAYYEVIMAVFVLVFIANCLIGKSKNENLAKKWYISNKNFLEENYAHLGHGRDFTPSSAPLLKESYNTFKFYASGRVFIKRLLTRMEVN